MTSKEIEEVLFRVVAEQLGHPLSMVDKDASFIADLGADSLDLQELLMAIEGEFDLEILDDDMRRVSTVGQLLDYLICRIAPLEAFKIVCDEQQSNQTTVQFIVNIMVAKADVDKLPTNDLERAIEEGVTAVVNQHMFIQARNTEGEVFKRRNPFAPTMRVMNVAYVEK